MKVKHCIQRIILKILCDFLCVFWLLLLFFSIFTKSALILSAYLNFVFKWYYIQLFFFLIVLFYFFTELSYSSFNVFFVYYNCYFWMSLISIRVEQSYCMHLDFESSSLISFANSCDIVLSSYFSKGDLSIWCLKRLLLDVCWFIAFDFRLFVC